MSETRTGKLISKRESHMAQIICVIFISDLALFKCIAIKANILWFRYKLEIAFVLVPAMRLEVLQVQRYYSLESFILTRSLSGRTFNMDRFRKECLCDGSRPLLPRIYSLGLSLAPPIITLGSELTRPYNIFKRRQLLASFRLVSVAGSNLHSTVDFLPLYPRSSYTA